MFTKHPDRFIMMLQALNPEQVIKIFDLLNIDLYWLHPTTHLHNAASQVLFGLLDHSVLGPSIQARYQNIKKLFDEFRFKCKASEIQPPIPYSKLLVFPDEKSDKYQPIYQLYLKAYFPAVRDLKNAAAQFKKSHEAETKTELRKKVYIAVRDGNLEKLKEEKITAVNLWKTDKAFKPMFLPSHLYKPIFEYYYKQALKENINPLIAAVYFHQKQELITLLRKHQIPIDIELDTYYPIDVSVTVGRSDFIELILENGTQSRMPLLNACDYMNRLAVLTFLEKNATPDYLTTTPSSPLSKIVERGMLDIAYMLLERGANVNVLVNHTNNPLFRAVDQGDVAMTELLLKNGAKINNYTDPKLTPLLCAIQNRNFDIVHLLLQHNADPNLHNPLEIAIRQNLSGAVLLLLQKGAKPNNIINEAGYTALHLAAEKGNPVIVRILLEHGADPALKASGKTPAEYALNEQCRLLLIERELLAVPAVPIMQIDDFHFFQRERKDEKVITIESKSAGKISFVDLPPKVKTKYFIQSMLKTDFPDCFKLTHPSPTVSQVFKEEKDLQDLANELEKQNQLESHISFFKSFLRNHPDRLAKMILAMKPENTIKVFQMLDMDLYLFNPVSELAEQAAQVRKLLKNSKTYDDKIWAWSKPFTEAFAKFHEKDRIFAAPIPYSVLLERAKKSTPEMRNVYIIYLKYYFSEKERRKVAVTKPKNPALAFVAAHEKRLEEHHKYKDIIIPLFDGDIKKLNKLDNESIWNNANRISELFTNVNHPEVLRHFYQLAERTYSDPKARLCWAVLCNQTDKIKEMKSEVNFDVWGMTPLYLAVLSKRYASVECLLEKNADPNLTSKEYKMAPIYGSADHGNYEMTRLLIERGADIEARTPIQKATSLIMAASMGYLNVVRLLCNSGAKLNAFDNDGFSALAIAVSYDRFEIVKYLLKAGADLAIEKTYPLAPSLKMNQILIAAELEDEMRKIPEEKSADYGRFFTGGGNTQQIKATVQTLLTILQGEALKRDFERHNAELSSMLTKEPWVRFYNKAKDIADKILPTIERKQP